MTNMLEGFWKEHIGSYGQDIGQWPPHLDHVSQRQHLGKVLSQKFNRDLTYATGVHIYDIGTES